MAILLCSLVHGANVWAHCTSQCWSFSFCVTLIIELRYISLNAVHSLCFFVICCLLFRLACLAVLPVQWEWLNEVQKLKYQSCVFLSAFNVVAIHKITNAAQWYHVCIARSSVLLELTVGCCLSIYSHARSFILRERVRFVFISVLLICIFDCIIYSSFTLVWL